MTSIEFFSYMGGQSIVLLGMSAWLGKVWANRISSKEKLQLQTELAAIKSDIDTKLAALNAKNESILHVSKIQYEREFANYARIWDLITPINQQFKFLFSHKKSYEFYKEELLKLGGMKSHFESEVSSMYPFIAESVYKDALKCMEIIQEHWHEIDQHLDFLEQKVYQRYTEMESVPVEKSIGKVINKTSTNMNNASIDLAKSIKRRNEAMVVFEGAA